jgi:hypothetical protein
MLKIFAIISLAVLTGTAASAVETALNSHLQKARESFVKKDTAKAADELRKASRWLEAAARRSPAEARAGLTDSAREIGKLADDVAHGTVKDAHDMDQAMARASLAVAHSHFVEASDAWTKKETKRSGHEIKLAADHLEAAGDWVGDETGRGAKTAAADARTVGDKLATGTGWSAEEVGRGIKSLGVAIDDLGNRVRGSAR